MMIPPLFVERIIRMRGSDGEAWLHIIPSIVEFWEEKWKLKFRQPKELNFNFVTSSDDDKVTLKICHQQAEFKLELETLRYYNCNVFCQLIDFDEEGCALLLQSLQPGTNLSHKSDDDAIAIVCGIIKEMELVTEQTVWGFPNAVDWMNAIDHRRIPDNLKAAAVRAGQIANELVFKQKHNRLLHGDLHHGNILQHGTKWKAIDPKGVIGETAFELIPFLLNNVNDENLAQTTDRRIAEFSRLLALDERRVLGWGLCRAVLAAWWNVEDNLEVSEKDMKFVHYFSDRLA